MDKSSDRGQAREKALSLESYRTDGYFSIEQWESYLFQINVIRKYVENLGGGVLEIGCGGGIVHAILQKIGYKADTLDINDNLNPTYVGDLSKVDFKLPNRYDCVLCAEVLEHIPFSNFDICLKNIRNLTNKYVLITLPNCKTSRFRTGVMINGHYKELKFGYKISKIAPMHFGK